MRHVTGLLLLASALLTAGCGADQQSPLVRAAVLGQTDEVARLLASGADPRERTSRGFTALGLAAREGRVAVIERLVRAGADPDIGGGLTPLIMAAGYGDTDMVRLLLERAPDLRLPANLFGRLDLWKARMGNCTEVLRLIEGRRDAPRAAKAGSR
jgi:ankyrin repeat protein